MNIPAVSVVVPVHNAATTLAATLGSVLAQSESDFELVAIDDGSTDASLSILLDFAARDPRIRVVSRSNKGVASTRNIGVQLGSGLLIAFLDADDIWHPDKLARHRQFHEKSPDIAASYARIAFIDSAPRTLAARTTSSVSPPPLGVADLLGENPVCTMSNLVVTRAAMALIGQFDEAMSHAEDQEWLMRAAAQGHAITGMDEVLVDYRLSPDGLSVDLDRMLEGWRTLAARYGDAAMMPVSVLAAEAVYCRYLARRALRSGASARIALGYARRGLRLDAHAFLADARRGWLTLFSSLVALALPRPARLRLFA